MARMNRFPDCRREVSPDTVSCPHCGCAVEAWKAAQAATARLVAVGAILLLLTVTLLVTLPPEGTVKLRQSKSNAAQQTLQTRLQSDARNVLPGTERSGAKHSVVDGAQQMAPDATATAIVARVAADHPFRGRTLLKFEV